MDPLDSPLPSVSGQPESALKSNTSDSLLMTFLDPSPTVVVVTVLVLLLTPLFLHFVIFRTKSSTTLPTFLLLGPSGSGKTSLMTTFSQGCELEEKTGKTQAPPVETRTSQAPLSLECDVPANMTASAQYRSENDPSLKGHKRFLLQDTPGHGKLRPHAIDTIRQQAASVKGVVFVVDSGVTNTAAWSDVAEYLYGVLLTVQKLQEAKISSGKDMEQGFRVLVACNKNDLFTALPAARIKKTLEEEIEKVRDTKSRGVMSVGEEDKDEVEWLGSSKKGAFTFESLEEVGIEVEFRGGCVNNDGWRRPLGEWVGGCL